MKSILTNAVLVGTIAFGAALTNGHAQTSGRPISIVVPQPAGNPTDAVARKMQPLLQQELGQTVIVENAPGAGGSIGTRKVLTTPPDSVSVLIASQTEPILTPFTIKQANYKPEDFVAVGLVARLPYVLTARPSLKANNLAELVELAKKAEQPLSFGNIGPGSMIHLLGEQWARKNGIKLNQVPYKGVPPVTQDIMGGQIDLTFLPLGGATLSMIESGKVKAIATTGASAPPQLPRLETIAGSNPSMADFVYGTWIALFVPAKTPSDVVARLNKAMSAVVKDPDLRAYVKGTGMDIASESSVPDLARFYTAETKLYQGLARQIGVTAE